MTDQTALTAEEEDLRRFFMDRGWVIQMDDRPGQSVHPFAELAAALRTVIIEAKAQGRAAAHPPATANCRICDLTYPSGTEHRCTDGWSEAAAHPPATVPEPPLPRGWRPDTATIPEPGTPPATVPDEGLRARLYEAVRPEFRTEGPGDPTRGASDLRAREAADRIYERLSATKAQEP